MITIYNISKRIVGLLLLLAMLLTLPGPASPARASGPYTVNVSYDGPDNNLGDGICYDGVAGCPLRAAIQEAFYDGAAVSITFDSSLAGNTLYLDSAYGTIIWSGTNVTVDGGANNITISGAYLNPGQSVFEIQGNGNLLTNLTVRDAPLDGIRMGDFAGVGAGNYNTIAYVTAIGNGRYGIYVYNGSGGTGNTIYNSLVGTSDGNATACTAGEANTSHGVYLQGVSNTFIGYSSILCNGNAGILEEGGASTEITANNISGNSWAGVWLKGSDLTTVRSNFIGTTSNGLQAFGNGGDGVTLSDGALSVNIGDVTVAGYRNIISGNALCGIRIDSGGALAGADVNGNFIGLGADGQTAIPNGEAGVAIFNFNSAYNTIGSSMATTMQYISGNTREGIYIQGSSYVTIGGSNYIGVNSLYGPAGNGREGILVVDSQTVMIYAEEIRNNGLAGVAVTGITSEGIRIQPEQVNSNGGLPIDLGNDGHTPNDVGDGDSGPNALLNYPEVNSSLPGGITGTACPGCYVYFYETSSNPTANGGGGTYLDVLIADGTTGDFAYTPPAGIISITMMAFSPVTSNNSEFGPAHTIATDSTDKVWLPFINK